MDGGGGNLGVAFDARPTRGVAQRAVELVNGFVNDGSMSGQLGDDRSERISGVGADSDI